MKINLLSLLLCTLALTAMEKDYIPSFENLAIDNQKNVTELLLHINNAELFGSFLLESWWPEREQRNVVKSPDSSSYTEVNYFRGVYVFNTLSKKQIAFFPHEGLLRTVYTPDGYQLNVSKRYGGYDWLFYYDLIPFYISSEQKNYIQTLRHYIFAKTILDQRKTEFGLNEDGYSTWQAIKGAFGAYFKLLAHTDGKRWILKRLITSQIQG